MWFLLLIVVVGLFVWIGCLWVLVLLWLVVVMFCWMIGYCIGVGLVGCFVGVLDLMVLFCLLFCFVYLVVRWLVIFYCWFCFIGYGFCGLIVSSMYGFVITIVDCLIGLGF